MYFSCSANSCAFFLLCCCKRRILQETERCGVRTSSKGIVDSKIGIFDGGSSGGKNFLSGSIAA